MANVRVVLNRAGMRQLLRSPEVLADLQRRGEAIAAAAGPGHRVEAQVGPARARVAVITDTFDAVRNEATSRTLTAAIGAGQ